ncbi:putative cellobiose dehydrogenase [Aspergillus ruber CBS 135680]|uniref:FAD/NAD(P)-binding domain-containing protein n=1 Tax=Aspergillus ruber (strain CBS 135680) TaxID=1388766 RepID=A0A017S554_ASPRC|nr:FAD/NAD(P)-binding domain-containing protein [Aspergillus ruber CBS 135680]EYE91315.1 FAD/NAD(P)-binding domain-containing protein [Aspergillus ruber CBS 135680]
MRSLTWLTTLTTALGVAASTTESSAYSDPATGIDFQRWCDDDSGMCFGMALPETVKSDFIGQMVVPLSDSKGWGGVSLSPSMTQSLLIAAWPNGDSGVGSLRQATSYTNPDVYQDASIAEIPDGVSVNSTHLTYTFLCKGCIVGSPTSFKASADTSFLGWALSKTNPTTPSSPSSVLSYHAAGFGTFEVLLSKAKSAKYSTWAAKAKSTATPSGSATPSSSALASQTPTPSVAPTVSNATYDYIVVGGGAAGIVAAERLAETKKKVLLVERGAASIASMGADNTLSWNSSLTPYDVPALGSSLSELGLVSDYLCPDTAGMAGCVLGGGTIINAMSFIHPPSRDFDDKWPQGWKWNDVSAAAKRMYSRNAGSMLPSADGKRYDQSLFKVLSSFLNRLGWKYVNQHEQPDERHQMYSYPSWSAADGIRAGPVRSYLPLAQDMDNFNLRLQTKVRRLVRRGGRVTGVEVEKENGGVEIIHVRAGGKVVLAAGSMSTPRILFNSGIGPDEQLKNVQSGSTGVTLPPSGEWINLPVGQNLKDHPMFTIKVDTRANFTTFNTSSVIPGPSAVVQRLYEQASGVLAQGGHRLQFWTSLEGTDGITRYFQASCSAAKNGVITMKLYLTHGATSSGVLGINGQGSTTIETEPYLQTEEDKEATTRFLQGLVKDLKNSPMGFSIQDFSDVETLLAQKTAGDHYLGTAKMGTDDGRKNGSSVVDTSAKVYGTENLYIVDASIHPDLPTGNTQAIVMIAAEAAVEKIVGSASQGISGAASSVVLSASAQPTVIAAATSTVDAVTTSVVDETQTTTKIESAVGPSDVATGVPGAPPAPSDAAPVHSDSAAPSDNQNVNAPVPVRTPTPSDASAEGQSEKPSQVASTIYMTATATATATHTNIVTLTHSSVSTVTVTAGQAQGQVQGQQGQSECTCAVY